MAVSRSLKTLEAMGLIERHRKLGDRRVDRIMVTQNGYDLLLKDPLGRIHDALTDFDETEQLKIVDGMQGFWISFNATGSYQTLIPTSA